MVDERLEIPVAEQQWNPTHDAPGSDQGVDGPANRNSPSTQLPEVCRAKDRYFLIDHRDTLEWRKQFENAGKFPV